jgi:hypothetical protein
VVSNNKATPKINLFLNITNDLWRKIKTLNTVKQYIKPNAASNTNVYFYDSRGVVVEKKYKKIGLS